MLARALEDGGRQSPTALQSSRSFLGDVTNTPVGGAKPRGTFHAPPPLSKAELLMNESPSQHAKCWTEAFVSPVHSGRRPPEMSAVSVAARLPGTPVGSQRQPLLPPSRAITTAVPISPAARATPSRTTPVVVLGSRNSSFVCNPSGRSSNRVSPHRREPEPDDIEHGPVSSHTTLADHFADILIPMLLDDAPCVPPLPPLAESFRTLMELDMSVFEIPPPPREELET